MFDQVTTVFRIQHRRSKRDDYCAERPLQISPNTTRSCGQSRGHMDKILFPPLFVLSPSTIQLLSSPELMPLNFYTSVGAKETLVKGIHHLKAEGADALISTPHPNHPAPRPTYFTPNQTIAFSKPCMPTGRYRFPPTERSRWSINTCLWPVMGVYQICQCGAQFLPLPSLQVPTVSSRILVSILTSLLTLITGARISVQTSGSNYFLSKM